MTQAIRKDFRIRPGQPWSQEFRVRNAETKELVNVAGDTIRFVYGEPGTPELTVGSGIVLGSIGTFTVTITDTSAFDGEYATQYKLWRSIGTNLQDKVVEGHLIGEDYDD